MSTDSTHQIMTRINDQQAQYDQLVETIRPNDGRRALYVNAEELELIRRALMSSRGTYRRQALNNQDMLATPLTDDARRDFRALLRLNTARAEELGQLLNRIDEV